MKKAYIAPEADFVSLAVEDVTNLDLEGGLNKFDVELSFNRDLADLFN